MDLSAENILEHYRHPRNVGALEHPSAKHHETNASCGDSVIISLQINDKVITEVRWEGSGCAVSQAAMSMLSELLPGMTVEDALAIPADRIRELLKVPISTRRIKCAFLGLHGLKNTLRAFSGNDPEDWPTTLAGS